MKLTKAIVESATLPETGQAFLWDSDLKGFGVKLIPSGRVYVVQSRVKGNTKRIVLGKHGVITLAEARKKAQIELSKMLEGKDPSIERKRETALSVTLGMIVDEYIKARRDLKKSSIADIHKHMRASFPDWKDKPLTHITRDKVAVRFRELSDRSPAQANQGFRVLRALLNYAMAAYRDDEKPILIENPVKVLSDTKVWNRVNPRSGRIPTEKIGLAWNLIQAEREKPEQTPTSRTFADISAFLLLTGARWNEAAGLTWDRLNLDEKWWHIPDPKNRNPVTFPLSDMAVKILSERPKVNEYVFPGRTKIGCVTDPRGIMKKVSDAVGVPLSAHDFRRTFRAVAGECRIELYRCKLLMNHRLSGDVTINSYTETSDLRYLSAEINKISNYITEQARIEAGENVVKLDVKRKQKRAGK